MLATIKCFIYDKNRKRKSVIHENKIQVFPSIPYFSPTELTSANSQHVYKLFHSFFLVHNNNSWYLLSTYYIQTFVLSLLHFDFIYFSQIFNKTTNTTPFCRWKHWSMKIFSNVPKLGNSHSWSETEPVCKQILRWFGTRVLCDFMLGLSQCTH